MIMPMGKRVLKKIEEIVREEMDAAGAQELLMPAMIPEEIYEKVDVERHLVPTCLR